MTLLAAAPVASPQNISSATLSAFFAIVVGLCALGMVGAIINITENRRMVRRAQPTAAERIVARSIIRVSIGRIVILTSSLCFAVLALLSAIGGDLELERNAAVWLWLVALSMPGIVTTVCGGFEMRDRVRTNRYLEAEQTVNDALDRAHEVMAKVLPATVRPARRA